MKMYLLFVLLMMVCLLQSSVAFQLPSRSLARLARSPTAVLSTATAGRFAQQPQSMRLWSQEADKEEVVVEQKEVVVAPVGKVKPKDLFAKYGIAYLITSITFAIISYALCYVLIANGVDVPKMLEKIGIESTSMASSTGTAALAYAVHKAASPIRFPPTVALTPTVARWLGRKDEKKKKTEEAVQPTS